MVANCLVALSGSKDCLVLPILTGSPSVAGGSDCWTLFAFWMPPTFKENKIKLPGLNQVPYVYLCTNGCSNGPNLSSTLFLTPKVSCGFWTKLGTVGHNWRNHFSQQNKCKN